MKSCENINQLMNLYIDKEASKEQEKELFLHINECPECKLELKMMQEIRNNLQQLGDAPLPEGFSESLHRKLILQTIDAPKTPFYKNWRMYSAVAAAVLFAMVIKTGYFDTMKQMQGELEVKPSSTPIASGNIVAAPDMTQIPAPLAPAHKEVQYDQSLQAPDQDSFGGAAVQSEHDAVENRTPINEDKGLQIEPTATIKPTASPQMTTPLTEQARSTSSPAPSPALTAPPGKGGSEERSDEITTGTMIMQIAPVPSAEEPEASMQKSDSIEGETVRMFVASEGVIIINVAHKNYEKVLKLIDNKIVTLEEFEKIKPELVKLGAKIEIEEPPGEVVEYFIIINIQ